MTSFVGKLFRVTGLCGLVLFPLTVSADISVNLDAGYLRQSSTTSGTTTTTALSTTGGGALLLLVASGAANGTTFTTPGAGQYVAGGDVILAAFGFNTNGGTSGTGGETRNTLTGLTYPTGVASSAYVELRWFPSITLTAYMGGTTPAGGTVFGAYNPLVTNSSNNTTLNPDGGSLWQLPGNGTTATLNFYTMDDFGGSQATTEGYTNFTVVPEPSAGILGGLAVIVMFGALRFRRAGTRLVTCHPLT